MLLFYFIYFFFFKTQLCSGTSQTTGPGSFTRSLWEELWKTFKFTAQLSTDKLNIITEIRIQDGLEGHLK